MNLKYKIVGFLLFTALGIQAQQERSLPILSQGQDARGVAMGGNSYGESTSLFIYGNPSSLFNKRQEVGNGAMYFQTQKIKGDMPLQLNSLGGSVAYGYQNQGFMLGSRYASYGEFSVITQGERRGGTQKNYDQTIDFGYAFNFGKTTAFATGSYVITHIGGTTSTFVGGVGVSYRDVFSISDEKINYVATTKISNIGGSFSYIKGGTITQPPLSIGLGGEINYTKTIHSASLGLGITRYLLPSEASSNQIQVGLEYAYDKTAMLRCGFLKDTNGFSAVSFGAGVNYKMFFADMAVLLPNSNVNVVSPQLSFSLGVSF